MAESLVLTCMLKSLLKSLFFLKFTPFNFEIELQSSKFSTFDKKFISRKRKCGIGLCFFHVSILIACTLFLFLILVYLALCVTAALDVMLIVLFPNCSDYINHQKQSPFSMYNFVCLFSNVPDVLKHVSREL
jgi:hypothetical protein